MDNFGAINLKLGNNLSWLYEKSKETHSFNCVAGSSLRFAELIVIPVISSGFL